MYDTLNFMIANFGHPVSNPSLDPVNIDSRYFKKFEEIHNERKIIRWRQLTFEYSCNTAFIPKILLMFLGILGAQ